jgi:biopolymer transport protein ExbD
MFGRRRFEETPVTPDLPITPMLDMSFQLMAFFVMTFRPAPTEGQFALAAMPAGDAVNLNPAIAPPALFIVRVEADKKGGIANVSLREKDGADPFPFDAGTDLKKLQAELKKRYDAVKGQPAKLTLEIDSSLLHEHAIRLIELGMKSGFESIAPVPIR